MIYDFEDYERETSFITESLILLAFDFSQNNCIFAW